MRLRISRSSATGMLMSRRTMRAGRIKGGIHRANSVLHGEANEFAAKEWA